MRVLAVAVIASGVVAVGTVSSIFSRQGNAAASSSARGVFESLVNPADYPESPHAWPGAEPIVIECWGDAEDRMRTRRLARLSRKLNRLESAQDLASAKQDAARTMKTFWLHPGVDSSSREKAEVRLAADAADAQVERLRAEWRETASAMNELQVELAGRHPLSVVTLRSANATRYGWDRDRNTATLSPVVAPFRDVGYVFPRDNRFLDRLDDRLDAVRDAYAVRQQATTPDDFVRARNAIGSAEAALDRAIDERDGRDALRNAIEQDVLEACAR